jgi:hypothetical protein
MPLVTNIRIVSADGQQSASTGNERTQQPEFRRDSDSKQLCTGRLNLADQQGISFVETIEDIAAGEIKIDLQITANGNPDLAGIYFSITVPASDYADGSAQLVGAANASALTATRPSTQNTYASGTAKGIKLSSPRRQLEISCDSEKDILVQDERRRGGGGIDVRLTLASGALTQGQQVHSVVTLKVAGQIDKSPVTLTLDPSKPGAPFIGVGGNFRLQNPTDPPIIQYNLENLRVAWGRFAMPLNLWHPQETTDPLEAAMAGQLNPQVRAAMEMGKTLAEKKMPIIGSAWQAPNWALGGTPPARGRGQAAPAIGAPRGRPINPDKLETLGKSIASYFLYMKQAYNTEVNYFSFNESDLGIDVRQTPVEHAQTIKTFGKIFADAGLKTKLLLGDTSDATPFDFIKVAMNDPQCTPFIGALSFHSWRGGTDEQLSRWGDAARSLKIPLIVGEGGTDAAAWNYRAMFVEPWFSLNEIDLYVRICRLCQPEAILQWQLTDDYSILTGGRNNQPLAPTQRFWQLKQLGATAAGSRWLPIQCNKDNISAAAFGDPQHGYAIHLVNNGPTRSTTIAGLPPEVKELRLYVTDAKRCMQQAGSVPVTQGSAKINLEAQTFTSLMTP